METTDVWNEIKDTFVETMVVVFLSDMYNPYSRFSEKVLQFIVTLLVHIFILATLPLFLAYCVRCRLKEKEERMWSILKGEKTTERY